MRYGMAVALAAMLAACSGAQTQGTGSATIGVRSSALTAPAAGTKVTLRVYDRADFTGTDLDIWNWSSDLYWTGDITGDTQVLDSMPVGTYTVCAKDDTYGPTCAKPVTVQKNVMATVNLILQQAGNNGSVTIDSPFIKAITLSDGAPSYGEDVTMSATVTGDPTLTYEWSLTCQGSNTTFSAQAATTIMTTDCKGGAAVTLVVSNGSNGDIHSSVTFPITYSPQGETVSVSLNNWPVITGFSVDQAQLQPGGHTNIGVTASDNEPLTYTWSTTCGTLLVPPSTTNGNQFTAPSSTGDCTVTVVVTDGLGGKSTASVILHVGNPVLTAVPYIEICYNAQWGSCSDVGSYSGGSFSADASSLTFNKTVADNVGVLDFSIVARIDGAKGLVFQSASIYVVGSGDAFSAGNPRFFATFADGTGCQIDQPTISGNMRSFTVASAQGNKNFFLDGHTEVGVTGVACSTKLAEPLANLVLIDDFGGGTGSITMSAIQVNGISVIP